MRTDIRCALLFSVLFLTGMRDPFEPPVDRCAVGLLSLWRYQGMVGGVANIGIVQDDQNRWRRVRQGDRLIAGWQVSAVAEQELVVNVGEGCEPKEWRWKREGTKNEKNTDGHHDAHAKRSGASRSVKARHPNGG